MKTVILPLEISIEGLNDIPDERKKDPVQLCVLVIKNIMINFANQHRGFQEPQRKQYWRLCDALDNALTLKLKEVEIENDLYGFLRACKRDGAMVPDELLRRVEILIDSVKPE